MTLRTLLIAVTLLAASGAAAAPPPKEPPPPAKAARSTPAPSPVPPAGTVMVGDIPILSVKANLHSFTPTDRAAAISRRIERLAGSQPESFDRIITISTETSTDIVAGDTILMSVTDGDARAEQKPRPELAEAYAEAIRKTVAQHLKNISPRQLAIDAAYAAATTLALVLLLLLIRWLYPKILAHIERRRGSLIRTIKFQSYEIINEDRLIAIFTGTARWTRALLVIGLFYVYVPLVLSYFPWTRGISSSLFDYIASPLQKVAHAVGVYLPNIFFIAVIAVITHFITRFVRLFFTEIERGTITIPGFYTDWAQPTFKLVRFMIIAFVVIVIFPYLPGSESPAFKGVTVFLGILLSLGSSSAIANVVAGSILTYMRAFKLGDRVKIADTVGDVEEKTLMVTRIRTIKNVHITIPNAMVLGSHITNFSSASKEYGLILHTTVTIGYDAPWRQVHQLLIDAARATENVLPLPEPFVLQTALNDFYVSYEINAYTDRPLSMARTYSQLHQNIQDAFNTAGVEIMSPHYSTIRDGNETTIPPQYRPDGYRPPPFRIRETGEE